MGTPRGTGADAFPRRDHKYTLRMFRRAVVTLLIWLALGTAWTIVLSWALATFAPLKRVDIEHRPALAGHRLSSATAVPEDWDLGCHVTAHGIGVRYELVTEAHWVGSTLGIMSGSRNRSIERAASGWPFSAMEWAGSLDDRLPRRLPGTSQPASLLAGLAPPINAGTFYQGAARRLPLIPLWPGFAMNVMVWGLAGWLTMSTGGAWRRARRRHRELCEQCAYPVGGCSRCSECGRVVRRHPESSVTDR